jgi:hypothetical protein
VVLGVREDVTAADARRIGRLPGHAPARRSNVCSCTTEGWA